MAKVYDEQLKREIVSEFVSGRTYSELSSKYGIAKTTILGWVKKYSEECQNIKPHSKSSIDTVNELREKNKRIAELEKENAFLKKAAAFFAKEID